MSAENAASPVVAGWRHAAGAHWAAYIDHKFVRQLGDGSLPRRAFLRYLEQDYLFLMHFSRAWALLLVKCERVQHMRIAAATVNALVNEEIALHVRICAQAGIDETALGQIDELPQNLAYTRFVIDAGLSGDSLDLLSALAPCVIGYGEIGKTLSLSPVPGNPYQDWIDTYASDDYQHVCQTVTELIDSVAADRLGGDATASPRWPSLCRRFRTASALEADFWAMGLAEPR